MRGNNDLRSQSQPCTEGALPLLKEPPCDLKDGPLLAAAKYLVRLEAAMRRDDLDMKLNFDGPGPCEFAADIYPGFDPIAYEMSLVTSDPSNTQAQKMGEG